MAASDANNLLGRMFNEQPIRPIIGSPCFYAVDFIVGPDAGEDADSVVGSVGHGNAASYRSYGGASKVAQSSSRQIGTSAVVTTLVGTTRDALTLDAAGSLSSVEKETLRSNTWPSTIARFAVARFEIPAMAT